MLRQSPWVGPQISIPSPLNPPITGPLTISPGKLIFPASGGKQDLVIKNTGDWAKAVMVSHFHFLFFSKHDGLQIESSEQGKMRILPEAFFLDVGDEKTISVTHTEGGSTACKLTIHYKNAPLDYSDPLDAFKPVPTKEKIDSDRVDVPVSMQMK